MRHDLLLVVAAIVIVAPWLYILASWLSRSESPRRARFPIQRSSRFATQRAHTGFGGRGMLFRITPWQRLDQLLPAVFLSLVFVPLAITAHRGFARGELGLDQTLVQHAPGYLDLLSQAVDVQYWTTLVVVLALLFVVAGRWRQGLLLLFADVSADLAGAGLKLLVNREELTTRAVSGHYMLLQNELFPSGHIIRATVTVGLIVAFVFWQRPQLRGPAVAAATVFLGVLGVTQASVGGHMPLDVLGGYVLAGVWLNVAIVLSRIALPSRQLNALPAGA